MKNIEANDDKSILFKKYIILILTYIYENVPSAVRFDISLAENLTGYNYKTEIGEINIIKFFETIDWLNREGYVRCDHFYVKLESVSNHKTLVGSIPVSISEKGIHRLESVYNNKQTFIEEFKDYALTISGKVAENITTAGIIELFRLFFK